MSGLSRALVVICYARGGRGTYWGGSMVPTRHYNQLQIYAHI